MKRVRGHDPDPERLEVSDPALKRALSTLSEDGPSTAELQRMRQRLMGVFEAPPPVHAPLLGWVRGPLAALLVGVALAAVIGWVRSKREHDARDVMEPSARAVDQAPPATPLSTLDAPSPAIEPHVQRDVVEPAPSVRVREPARARARHVRAGAPRAAGDGARSIAATSGDATADGPRVASTSAAPAPAVATVAQSSVDRAEESRVEGAHKPAAPAPLDEASLLQRARQLAASEPEASLRFLNEHKRRFAHGMLTPEREVLAIELLRALSRQDEAARRLGEFRRNFPDSVYLQRLAR